MPKIVGIEENIDNRKHLRKNGKILNTIEDETINGFINLKLVLPVTETPNTYLDKLKIVTWYFHLL